MNYFDIDPNLLVAVLALIVSIISVIIAARSFRVQNRVSKLEQQIMEFELAEKQRAEKELTATRVEARHISIGPDKHKIRISNTGSQRVTNVRYCVNDEQSSGLFYHDKEPYEFLEPGDSYDELMFTYSGMPRKIVVVTYWVNNNGVEMSRENIISY